MLTRLFPVAQWFKEYTPRFAALDLLAGITLAFFVLPESVAYASLAGVAPEMGIYCCIAGCFLFALVTQSRQVAVGPTSAISLMVGTIAATLSGGDPVRWAAIASLTALAVFALCILAYVLRLSTLVNFISENILLGFKSGVALSIGITQLPKLMGIDGAGRNFFERLSHVINSLGETNITVLGFGIIALAILVLGNKLLPGRPVSLALVIGSILLVEFAPALTNPLHIVGEIHAGLPSIQPPSLRFRDVEGVFALALGCFLMGYIETMAAARTFAAKNGYEVNPRQELLSLGAANLGAAFAGGYPVAGGMSQSTVNDKAGAKTPLALIVCSVTLSVILLYFIGFLKNLPEVVLAVIVIDAVAGLIKVKELRKLYHLSRSEFFISMIAVAGVLSFGILQGVLIAALSSIVYLLSRISTPLVVELGRVPGSAQFSDIQRHPDNERIPNCKIIRVESSLFYFNENHVFQHILGLLESSLETRLVILEMSSTPNVDVSASRMLLRLDNELAKKGIAFRIVNALSNVRDLLRKQGLEGGVGHISRRLTIEQIVEDFKGRLHS